MLGLFRKKKHTAEEIKANRDKSLNDMLRRSEALKKFVENNQSGWKEFCVLLNNYIESCKKRKAITPLDIADSETIKQLVLLDHEVYILHFVLQMPDQFIKKTQDAIERVNKEGASGA